MNKTDIIAAIFHGIDEINKQLTPAERLVKTEQTPLSGAVLESLNMVNFLITVEEQLLLEYRIQIDLAAALTPSAAVPFKTVSELADYILRNSSPAE